MSSRTSCSSRGASAGLRHPQRHDGASTAAYALLSPGHGGVPQSALYNLLARLRQRGGQGSPALLHYEGRGQDLRVIRWFPRDAKGSGPTLLARLRLLHYPRLDAFLQPCDLFIAVKQCVMLSVQVLPRCHGKIGMAPGLAQNADIRRGIKVVASGWRRCPAVALRCVA
jgi:hypothetical protein